MSETMLKPCPFCGGKAKMKLRQFDLFQVGVQVICQTCGCRTDLIAPSTEYAARDKAIEAWNRRICTDE